MSTFVLIWNIHCPLVGLSLPGSGLFPVQTLCATLLTLIKGILCDFFNLTLKEYYEIVGESHPLSAFFPKHADFFTEMHFYS